MQAEIHHEQRSIITRETLRHPLDSHAKTSQLYRVGRPANLHQFKILISFPGIVHSFRDKWITEIFDVFLSYNRTVGIGVLGRRINNFKLS